MKISCFMNIAVLFFLLKQLLNTPFAGIINMRLRFSGAKVNKKIVLVGFWG